MEQIRTFIAIEIPNDVREKIGEFQKRLKEQDCRISWGKPEDIHLTLKFLGDVAADKIKDIGHAIANVCKMYKPFPIRVQGAGVFPNFKKPRVIWIGAESDNMILHALAKNIDDEIHTIGFEKEIRGFKAHLTLGRVKSLPGIDRVLKIIEQHDDFFGGEFTAGEIVIMKSDLKPTGAVYTPLNKITFK